MCGIAGIVHYGDGRPVDPSLVQAMADALRHRGPDGDGVVVDGAVGLASRRLAVVDPVASTQPLADEHGTAILVYNGEVYNFRELRAELVGLGCRFRTAGDTEVILQAYRRWGTAAFARLNGMFALAIWDVARRTLTLARDPLGIKPLYLLDDGRRVAFASEMRALTAARLLTPAVDTAHLADFLAYGFVPAPATLVAGVRRLLPGHVLECSPEGVTSCRFSAPIGPPLPPARDEELVDELRRLLRAAVRRQMVADVPVGLLLSGGVDSAALAALMTETAAGPVRTFTVGFAGDFAGNELRAARRVAHRLAAEHTELCLSSAAFAETLTEAARHLEEPLDTTSTVPFLALSRLARRHVTVALCGQGADEPFGGYPRHAAEAAGRLLRLLPLSPRAGITASVVARLADAGRMQRAAAALSLTDADARLSAILTARDEKARRDLLHDSLPAEVDGAALARLRADTPTLPPLDQLLYIDARFGLADNLLLYADKLSMAASLEVRVPYLDLDLLAFVERIPARLKTGPLRRKRLLKRALAAWLPDDTLRRRKVGFATPFGEWLRRELAGPVRERLLAPESATRHYFREESVARLLREHAEGRHDHQRTLFSLWMFDLWHEQCIEFAAGSE